MISAASALCDLFNCSMNELNFILKDRKSLTKAESFLSSHILFTNYHLKPKRVLLKCIMRNLNSKMAFAYDGHLGVTVEGHFYSKYKIDLKYPHLPVLMQKIDGIRRIYPLELLEIIYNVNHICDDCRGPYCKWLPNCIESNK